MRTSILLAALVALTSATALADARDTTPANTGSKSSATTTKPGEMKTGSAEMGDMKHDATASAGAAMGKEMFTSEMVMNKIHAINMEEIAGAKMARSNGDKSVHGYAERMLKDHTQADKDLMTLAEKKNVTLRDPMAATNMPQAEKDKMVQHKAMMDQMQTQKGAEFDKGYLTMMSAGHGEALDFLKQAQDNVEDKDVRSFVTKLVPVVTEHKKMADGLLKKTGKVQGRR